MSAKMNAYNATVRISQTGNCWFCTIQTVFNRSGLTMKPCCRSFRMQRLYLYRLDSYLTGFCSFRNEAIIQLVKLACRINQNDRVDKYGTEKARKGFWLGISALGPASELNLGEISLMFVAFYHKTRAKIEIDAIGRQFQQGQANQIGVEANRDPSIRYSKTMLNNATQFYCFTRIRKSTWDYSSKIPNVLVRQDSNRLARLRQQANSRRRTCAKA